MKNKPVFLSTVSTSLYIIGVMYGRNYKGIPYPQWAWNKMADILQMTF